MTQGLVVYRVLSVKILIVFPGGFAAMLLLGFDRRTPLFHCLTSPMSEPAWLM